MSSETERWRRFAPALAVATVAAVVAVRVFGVPLGSLLLVGLFLLCPLLMMGMMIGMHGSHGATEGEEPGHHDGEADAGSSMPGPEAHAGWFR